MDGYKRDGWSLSFDTFNVTYFEFNPGVWTVQLRRLPRGDKDEIDFTIWSPQIIN